MQLPRADLKPPLAASLPILHPQRPRVIKVNLPVVGLAVIRRMLDIDVDIRHDLAHSADHHVVVDVGVVREVHSSGQLSQHLVMKEVRDAITGS
jgi:ubiquinone biosynthesis protein UbiJ